MELKYLRSILGGDGAIISTMTSKLNANVTLLTEAACDLLSLRRLLDLDEAGVMLSNVKLSKDKSIAENIVIHNSDGNISRIYKIVDPNKAMSPNANEVN